MADATFGRWCRSCSSMVTVVVPSPGELALHATLREPGSTPISLPDEFGPVVGEQVPWQLLCRACRAWWLETLGLEVMGEP